MTDLLQSLFQGPQPWGMIITVVLIGCAAGVIGTVAGEIRKYACHRKDVELKRDLVERGLTVEEVERIVGTKKSNSGQEKRDMNAKR